MFKPSCVVAFGVLAVVILSGCSGTSHPVAPKTLNQTTSSSASTVARPSPSPSPSTNVVPVDQIPPGNPESWVPAGVPTKGPFQETGDEVPQFTRPMFSNERKGANAVALYYVDALNWSFALGEDPTPLLAVCDSDRCLQNSRVAAKNRALHRHLIGGRLHLTSVAILDRPPGTGADFVFKLGLSIAASTLVDSAGKVVTKSASKSLAVNLYLKWNETMWRVIGDYLAVK